MYMRKCAIISPYMRRPLVIYDFATAPSWISLNMRKIWFSFLSVYNTPPTTAQPSQYIERGRGATATGASRTADAVGPGGGGPTIWIRQTWRNEGGGGGWNEGGGGGGWSDGRPHQGGRYCNIRDGGNGQRSRFHLEAVRNDKRPEGWLSKRIRIRRLRRKGREDPQSLLGRPWPLNGNFKYSFFPLNSYVFCFLY